MGRRPQPNRRRGLLRATAAVVGLIILLIVVVTVVSSLTAPAVKAPTAPPTPGPISRTPAAGTPTTPRPTPRAATTPKPAPSSTATGKHKRVALGALTLDEHAASASFGAVSRHFSREISPAVAPRGDTVAYFARAGGAYQPTPLLAQHGNSVTRVGSGDRFVRPVWSPDGQHVLYVKVRAGVAAIPGARWTLMQWDRRANESHAVARVAALAITPLGWRHGQVTWSVAQPTTTDVYTMDDGHAKRLATVLAQPLVDMSLSPNGRYLAFGAPDNCGRCTLDIYNLARSSVWVGPTGMVNSSALAWTRHGTMVVGDMGRRLVLINPRDDVTRHVPAPHGLPRRWLDIMRASDHDGRVSLQDTVTGRSYTDHGAAR